MVIVVCDKYLCIVHVVIKVYTKNWPTRKRIDRFDRLQVVAIDLNLIPTPYFKRQTKRSDISTTQRTTLSERGKVRRRARAVSLRFFDSHYLRFSLNSFGHFNLVPPFLPSLLFFPSLFFVYFCAWSYHTFRKRWHPRSQWDDGFYKFFTKVYVDIVTTMQRSLDRSPLFVIGGKKAME